MPNRDAEIPVLPLWVDGHAYLTIPPAFGMVRRAGNAEPLRRIPICGRTEIDRAMQSAADALVDWSGMTDDDRRVFLQQLASLLENYRAHFVALITEESALGQTAAATEVDAVIACLQQPPRGADAGVVVIGSDPMRPFAHVLCQAIAALMAGGTVVVVTHTEVPSSLFALAELTGRSDWPRGVFSLLYGDAYTLAMAQQAGFAGGAGRL